MCAMVKSRYIGDGHPTFNRNPYKGYINPYYWVDDHPLVYGKEFRPWHMSRVSSLTTAGFSLSDPQTSMVVSGSAKFGGIGGSPSIPQLAGF